VITDNDVVIKYAHLENSVVCADAQVWDCHNADKLYRHTNTSTRNTIIT